MSERLVSSRVVAFALVLAIVLPTLISVGINLYLDPFQLFHKDWKTPATFIARRGADRYQQAGVVRQYQPESVFIGHSHSANFLPTDGEALLGWRGVYSLSLDGGPLKEQRKVVEFALDNAPVKNVLWTFAPYNLAADADSMNPRMQFPGYLYDGNRLNDLKIYLSLPFQFLTYSETKARLRATVAEESARLGIAFDARDLSTAWMPNSGQRFNHSEVVAQDILGKRMRDPMDGAKARARRVLSSVDIENLEMSAGYGESFHANVQENILPVISSNPETQFYVVIQPPFPLLYHQRNKSKRYKWYVSSLVYIRLLVKELSAFENVRVFGFGTVAFAQDLRLYKDDRHYHGAVNRYMLERIAAGEGELDSKNVVSYLHHFDAAVTGYQFELPDRLTSSDSSKRKESGLSYTAARSIMERYESRFEF